MNLFKELLFAIAFVSYPSSTWKIPNDCFGRSEPLHCHRHAWFAWMATSFYDTWNAFGDECCRPTGESHRSIFRSPLSCRRSFKRILLLNFIRFPKKKSSPEVTEKSDETSAEEYHEVIILFSGDFRKSRSQVRNQIIGILLVRVEDVVATLRCDQSSIPYALTELQLESEFDGNI